MNVNLNEEERQYLLSMLIHSEASTKDRLYFEEDNITKEEKQELDEELRICQKLQVMLAEAE